MEVRRRQREVSTFAEEEGGGGGAKPLLLDSLGRELIAILTTLSLTTLTVAALVSQRYRPLGLGP
jgi:hypothetical protein